MTKYVDNTGVMYNVYNFNNNIRYAEFDFTDDWRHYLMCLIDENGLYNFIVNNLEIEHEWSGPTSDTNVNIHYEYNMVNTGINTSTEETRTDTLKATFKWDKNNSEYRFYLDIISGVRGAEIDLISRSFTPVSWLPTFKLVIYKGYIKANNIDVFGHFVVLNQYQANGSLYSRDVSVPALIGGSGTWYNINWALDLEERELDSTDNTGIGGGYGTGSMPHDNINVPTLPNISLFNAGNALYKLQESTLKNFTKWLWTTDWVENLKKIRTDPMQNIIGISIADFSIPTSLNGLITVGNVATTVAADIITQSFIEVDCGTITLDEYYGSFADYEPFIATTLYLPKVGFVQIPADVCVNNTIKVVYHIELSSGEGLCYVQLTSKRDGFTYIWNTYTCHVTSNITLSAQDHSQQLVALGNAIINTGISVGNAIVNPASAAQGLSNTLSSCIDVATTKNPTSTKGNVGNMSAVMCYKKPYLLINRTNLTKPVSFQDNNGYLINYTAKINEHTGFLKTKDFHAEFNAPYNHKVEIERIMDEGVFING